MNLVKQGQKIDRGIYLSQRASEVYVGLAAGIMSTKWSEGSKELDAESTKKTTHSLWYSGENTL